MKISLVQNLSRQYLNKKICKGRENLSIEKEFVDEFRRQAFFADVNLFKYRL